jgi:hypothetical protein
MMDSKRFDTLVRTLTRSERTPTRRSLARALAGGAMFGWVVAAVEDAGAEADAAGKGKGKGKGCKPGQRRCGKKCIPKDSCCKDDDCDFCREEKCVKGRCGCGKGEIDHNGVCGKFPLCQSVGLLCESDRDCCSGHCNVVSDDGVTTRCNRGLQRCITDLDCDPGFHCRGFSCTFAPPCP